MKLFFVTLIYVLCIFVNAECKCECPKREIRRRVSSSSSRNLLTIDEILLEITEKLEFLENQTISVKNSFNDARNNLVIIQGQIINGSRAVILEVSETINSTKQNIKEEFTIFKEILIEFGSSFLSYVYLFIGLFISLIFLYGFIKYLCRKYCCCSRRQNETSIPKEESELCRCCRKKPGSINPLKKGI